MISPKKVSSNTTLQQFRLLDFIHNFGSITTIQARDELDIMSPATRVMELRDKGYNIVTELITIDTVKGRHSKVAKYILLSDETLKAIV
ncbi:MAG: helix-turn-helix domain-containing protein [Methylococcaceae bacterium]|nr:helix-turn-helix domain-containing protein [Methylococcaceae bacterium]